MATEPKNIQDTPPRERRLPFAARAGISLGIVLVAVGLACLALWINRTAVLEQLARWYLRGDGITSVELRVEQADSDLLLVRDLRIAGRTTISVNTLRFDYQITRLLNATIRRIELEGIRVEGLGAPVEIERIEGDGEIIAERSSLRSVAMGLDVLRLRVGYHTFEPGRIDIGYIDGDLSLDAAVSTQGGYLAVIGYGPPGSSQHPFRINLSGLVNTALLEPFLAPDVMTSGTVDLSLAGEIDEPLSLLNRDMKAGETRSLRLSAEGEIGLRLAHLSINGAEWPAPIDDRIGFTVTDMTVGPGTARGGVEIDIKLGRRETEGFGFDDAQIILSGLLDLTDDRLSLDLAKGPLLNVSGARIRQGVPLRGDLSLRLRREDNRIAIDLQDGAASHRLDAVLTWPDGEVRLNSEGHITDRNDPTVFTVRGAFDATPLLALFRETADAKGNASIFLAGRISQPLLLFGRDTARLAEGDGWPGDLRFDGAFKLETEGTRIPHLTAKGTPKDSIEIALKSFDGSRSYQTGRVSVTASLDGRSIGGTTLDGAKLNLNGRLVADQHGYRFEPFFESTLAVGRVETEAGFEIPDGVTLQLSGTDNYVTMPRDFSEIRHRLNFAHLEARGLILNGEPRTIRIVVPQLGSQDTEGGQRRIHLRDARLDLADSQVNVTGIGATADFDSDKLDFAFDANDIRHMAKPPLTTPITLSGKGSLAGDILTATVKARQIFSPLALHAKLRHELSKNAGRLDFTVPVARLDPEKKTVLDVFPSAAGWVDSAGGTTGAEGHLLWDRDVASGQMTVSVEDGIFQTRDVRLTRVSGNVNFIELLPLTTPPRQRIDAVLNVPKFGVLPTWIEFQLRDDGKVEIQELDVEVAGGHLHTKGLIEAGETLSVDANVGVNSVDVATLFEIIGVEGLSGTGRISGELPLRYTGDGVAISKGALHALEPGTLRYIGTRLQEMLAEREDVVAMVAKALSDFHYDTLSMELEKDAGGHGFIMLRMNGRNPAVYDGHPFVFNIRLESNFDQLGRIALGGTRAVIDVMRRAGATDAQE